MNITTKFDIGDKVSPPANGDFVIKFITLDAEAVVYGDGFSNYWSERNLTLVSKRCEHKLPNGGPWSARSLSFIGGPIAWTPNYCPDCGVKL